MGWAEPHRPRGADDLLAGPVELIDVAHLAVEHRAATDGIRRLRDEVTALRAVVRLCVTGSSPYKPRGTGPWTIEDMGYESRPVTEAQALAVQRALRPHLLSPDPETATRKDQPTL